MPFGPHPSWVGCIMNIPSRLPARERYFCGRQGFITNIRWCLPACDRVIADYTPWRQLAPSTADVASRASCAWVWLGREMAKALIRECLKAVRGSFPGCCGRGRLAYR
jgi:hypothetical protein